MPCLRLFLAAFRLPRRLFAGAASGATLFGVGLLVVGVGVVAVAGGPMLAGAPAASAAVSCTTPCDPGVRPGVAAGGFISGLSTTQIALFNSTKQTFGEIDSVSGSMAGEAGSGLGPRFNMNSCSGCHAQPAVGGSSPATNPQVAVAKLRGATNSVPFFITLNGPVREARFKRNADGSPDGGVHDLFTISGRTDAPGCNIAQPDFNTAAAQGNLIFRIPTPTFGAGLIEGIPDSAILRNEGANQRGKALLGISGKVNREGNTGTITRYGWKAQNKSLLLFAGEAYNVEQGVTNEVFPNERTEAGCVFNGIPEDHTDFDTGASGDLVQFSIFMRFLAAPTPGPSTPSTTNGQKLFGTVGCGLCHTPRFVTARSSTPLALSNKDVDLFSDLLVHDMGSGLADGISQGSAGPDEFRTAPLWGIGQRIFFLHDGRTTDLLEAIRAHASAGSEANAVINNFNALGAWQKQDVLNFLRSL